VLRREHGAEVGRAGRPLRRLLLLEIRQHLGGALVAVRGIRFEAPHDHSLEEHGQVGIQSRG
jgi:hypothetical protein